MVGTFPAVDFWDCRIRRGGAQYGDVGEHHPEFSGWNLWKSTQAIKILPGYHQWDLQGWAQGKYSMGRGQMRDEMSGNYLGRGKDCGINFLDWKETFSCCWRLWKNGIHPSLSGILLQDMECPQSPKSWIFSLQSCSQNKAAPWANREFWERADPKDYSWPSPPFWAGPH